MTLCATGCGARAFVLNGFLFLHEGGAFVKMILVSNTIIDKAAGYHQLKGMLTDRDTSPLGTAGIPDARPYPWRAARRRVEPC